MTLKTYLICISYNNFKKGKNIIDQFIDSDNKNKATLLFVENGNKHNFDIYIKKYNFKKALKIHYFKSPNKAKCINYLIKNIIKENDALIVCIDNDIEFNNGFISKYQEVAFVKGDKFFFGGSYNVPKKLSNLADKKYKNMYQPSQFSKSDKAFLKMEKLIFLGFNYAFYKSQWLKVGGLDERFSPGSKFDLAADESIFQKKMMYAGYKPFLVTNNIVVHKPEASSYRVDAVKKRTIHNGYTHGFCRLIESKHYLKLDYFIILVGMVKSLFEYKLKKQYFRYFKKKFYTKGYFKAFKTYIKISNKKSIYHNLKKIE